MQIIDVCRTHFPSGTFRKPTLGHGRAPTRRKVTTERVSLSADQTRASLRAARGRKSQFWIIFFFPAGCWPGFDFHPPPQTSPRLFNELSKRRRSPTQVQLSSGLVPGEGRTPQKKKKVGFFCLFCLFFPGCRSRGEHPPAPRTLGR